MDLLLFKKSCRGCAYLLLYINIQRPYILYISKEPSGLWNHNKKQTSRKGGASKRERKKNLLAAAGRENGSSFHMSRNIPQKERKEPPARYKSTKKYITRRRRRKKLVVCLPCVCVVPWRYHSSGACNVPENVCHEGGGNQVFILNTYVRIVRTTKLGVLLLLLLLFLSQLHRWPTRATSSCTRQAIWSVFKSIPGR